MEDDRVTMRQSPNGINMPAKALREFICRNWPQLLVFVAGYGFVLYTKAWDWAVAPRWPPKLLHL